MSNIVAIVGYLWVLASCAYCILLQLMNRFTFTQLDAGDSNRTFSFVLNVNDEDTYDVEETSPPLNQADLTSLLQNLNETDDLAAFVRGMRGVFSGTL